MSTAAQRIYTVTNKATKEAKLVKASNQAQALRFVASDTFSVDVASAIEVAERMAGGAPVYSAAPEPASTGSDE